MAHHHSLSQADVGTNECSLGIGPTLHACTQEPSASSRPSHKVIMTDLVKHHAESKYALDASSFYQSGIPVQKGINEDMFCFLRFRVGTE